MRRAALVVAAVLGAAGCSSLGSAPTRPPSQPVPGPTHALGCRAGQLSATVAGPGVAAGNVIYRIRLADRGAPCTLQGRPLSLQGVTASGRIVTLHPDHLAPEWVQAATTQRPANLTRQHPAEVVLHTSDACGGSTTTYPSWTFPRLRLGIGKHQTVPVLFGQPYERGMHGVTLNCGRSGLELSRFYAASPA